MKSRSVWTGTNYPFCRVVARDLETIVDLSVDQKSLGEMRVNDASISFAFQSFLVALANHGIKGIHIRPFRSGKLVVHIRAFGIMGGHYLVYFGC